MLILKIILMTKLKKMAEIKTLEEFKEYAQKHLNSLKASEKADGFYIVKIEVSSYFDAICIARNLIRACMFVIDPEGAEMYNEKDNKINPCDMLDLALQIMPFSEFEMIDEIQKMVNSKNDK